jgi:positive regulator of sigma E activity
LAATKPVILMLMIASLVCAVLAVFLSLLSEVSVIIAIPGFVVGVFFAFRYAMYNRTREHEEEHKRSRKRYKH